MQDNFDEGVRRIVNSVRGITNKPVKLKSENIASTLMQSVSGLSKGALSVGLFVLYAADPDSGNITAFSGPDLNLGLELPPQTINDAVDELEEAGLVRTVKAINTAPYQFVQMEPTYVLYRELEEYLSYSPEQDIDITAAAIASVEHIRSKELSDQTNLSPGHLNRAIEYLVDYGIIERRQHMGTSPSYFLRLSPHVDLVYL